MTNYDDGYVYVAHAMGTGLYKIGKSISPHSRDLLGVILPFDMTDLPPVIMLHMIRTNGMARLESYLHRRFATKRGDGEWFQLTPQDVADLRKTTRVVFRDMDSYEEARKRRATRPKREPKPQRFGLLPDGTSRYNLERLFQNDNQLEG